MYNCFNFVENANLFLKKTGCILMAVKARSIDVVRTPSEIYKKEIRTLQERGFHVTELVDLEPYDRAHIMVVAEYQR